MRWLWKTDRPIRQELANVGANIMLDWAGFAAIAACLAGSAALAVLARWLLTRRNRGSRAVWLLLAAATLLLALGLWLDVAAWRDAGLSPVAGERRNPANLVRAAAIVAAIGTAFNAIVAIF